MGHGCGSFDGWLERVHPEDRARLAREKEAFLSSSARYACLEYRMARGEGGYVSVAERFVVERSPEGRPLRVVSVVDECVAKPADEAGGRYQGLFRRTRDAVVLVDARGRLRDFNPGLLALLDLTAEEAMGRPLASHYRDREARDAFVERIRSEGSVSDLELDLVASDGTRRVVLASAVAVRDDEGAYAGHQAILHDITERSRDEEDRRRQAARLQERVGMLRTLNAISERLLRAVRLDEDLLAQIVDLIPEGLRSASDARARLAVDTLEVAAPGFDPGTAQVLPLARGIEGAPPGAVAVSRPISDGEETPMELTDGDVEFLEEVAARLTETARRIDAEEGRRREETYHGLLVERSQDLLAILNADGALRFASSAAERILGYDAASLVGEQALDLIHPDDREAVAEVLSEAVRYPDRALTIEHRARHADGSWRYLESTGRSFLDDPDIRGVVVNSRDVTDRKGLEEQLLHAQKMEAVARLAGGVAHEFNNLLTVIRVSASLLDDHFDEGGRPEELDDIEAAATGAAVLTRRLLAFSGRDVRSPRLLDLRTVVEELEPFLSREAGDAVELVLDLPPTPLRIRADLLQIEQVVLNLVENAVEAMPEGGRVRVVVRTPEPGELPPQVRHPGQWALLRVVDSGSGVPESIRDSIFEPFFTTKEGGTGLGLATVRTVVSRLGGFLEVEGAPGGGASFMVCVPRSEVGSPSGAPPQEPEEEVVADRADFPRGRTVLVVDGDPAGRSVVEEVLTGAGYRVLDAHDGVSALTLLDAYEGPLDLLLVAWDMPYVRGDELTARVQATHPDVAVLYVVAAGEPEPPDGPTVRREALSTGVLAAVEQLLGSGEAARGPPA